MGWTDLFGRIEESKRRKEEAERLIREARRPELSQILRDYQVPDAPPGEGGGLVTWEPRWWGRSHEDWADDIPFLPDVERDKDGDGEYDPIKVTQQEADMLNDLSNDINGPLKLRALAGIEATAADESIKRFEPHSQEETDGHQDAFRHAYWNALMTREMGVEWTTEFTNAHEGVHGSPDEREAMDLHNNQVGRRIAYENPHASDEELADLIENAVRNGETLVIDGREGNEGELAWSDIPVGQHGEATGESTDPSAPSPDVLTPYKPLAY